MREILFRGKKESDNEWIDGYYVQTNDYLDEKKHNLIFEVNSVNYPRCEIAGVHEVDPETVGQFTGLTDKNGAKIFEGDIIQTDDTDEEPAKVFYDEEETEFAVIIDNCYYGLGSNFNETDLTVIGNIHDNPELLWDGGAKDES